MVKKCLPSPVFSSAVKRSLSETEERGVRLKRSVSLKRRSGSCEITTKARERRMERGTVEMSTPSRVMEPDLRGRRRRRERRSVDLPLGKRMLVSVGWRGRGRGRGTYEPVRPVIVRSLPAFMCRFIFRNASFSPLIFVNFLSLLAI